MNYIWPKLLHRAMKKFVDRVVVKVNEMVIVVGAVKSISKYRDAFISLLP